MDQELIQSNANTPRFSLKGLILSAKCVHVYDGDTAHFTFRPLPGSDVYKFTCRMFGYNTAEINGRTEAERIKAQESKGALAGCILNKIITLRIGNFDKYGRPLVEAYVGDTSVNDWMIANGYGVVYYGEGEKLW